MKDNNCGYCVEGELLDNFGIKIGELKTSLVILFKEQSHKGRIIVAHKSHIGEIVELSESERSAFFEDVNKVASVIHELFKPDKINYGAYGDSGNHLHFHLVPKYKDEFEWCSVFAMNPEKVYLSEEEYSEMVSTIATALEL